MITREEFDSAMAEFDRRQLSLSQRLLETQAGQAGIIASVEEQRLALIKLDDSMTALIARTGDLIKVSGIQGTSIERLWDEHVAHRNTQEDINHDKEQRLRGLAQACPRPRGRG